MRTPRIILTALAAAVALATGPARGAARGKETAHAASTAAVDVNRASQKELEALPGVGAATAKKIIAGRPYASVSELSRAGLSAKTIEKLTPLVTVGSAAAAAPASAPSGKSRKELAPAAVASGPLDLNTASEKDLEALPGVGPATAKKIVAGRPYSSVEDLQRAGLSESAIRKVTPLVKVDAAAAIPKTEPPPKPAKAPAARAGAAVDLNTASQKELESLPGVGPATAKKIIAGRPYASVADLSRAGVPAKTAEKIAPLVTAGSSAAASAPAREGPASAREAPAPPAATPAPSAAPRSAPAPAASAEARTPPAPGMVWVNTATKVYHREGDPWYGRTKEGKFMTEADAIKAGFRASKTGAPRK